jgi:hypothetical protein
MQPRHLPLIAIKQLLDQPFLTSALLNLLVKTGEYKSKHASILEIRMIAFLFIGKTKINS